MIIDIIKKLTRNHYQVKLISGFQDACGGYGWHVFFMITVYETIEFCPKCRKKMNVDYSDDAHIWNNHKNETELKTIFYDKFFDEETMCKSLKNHFEKYFL